MQRRGKIDQIELGLYVKNYNKLIKESGENNLKITIRDQTGGSISLLFNPREANKDANMGKSQHGIILRVKMLDTHLSTTRVASLSSYFNAML